MRQESKVNCINRFRPLLEIVSPGWVAGGAVRDFFSDREIDSDVDVFFANEIAYEETRKRIEVDKRFVTIYSGAKLSCFKFDGMEVQLIGTHFFQNPTETIKGFDFTVCCCAVDASDVFTHEHFIEDLAAKRLAINNLPFPLSTLERLQKYAKKGFTACNGTLLEIVKAIQKVDLSDKSNTLSFYRNGKPKFIRYD